MSLRKLNGVAYSIAHQFAASSEYFLALATSAGVQQLRIELLQGTIQPAGLDIPRNRILLTRCQSTLNAALAKFPQVRLEMATLEVNLDLPHAAQPAGTYGAVPATYTVTLADARKHVWRGVFHNDKALVATV